MRSSLALRLVASAALVSVAVLAVGGVVLSSVFRESIEDSFDARLNILLESLVATTDIVDGQPILQRPLADPRFEQVYSGWYWQIDGPSDVQLRSRSLFDQVLAPGQSSGPDGETLRILARQILLPGAAAAFDFTIAADEVEIDAQVARFNSVLGWSLGLLAAGLIIAVVVQVRFGLLPLARITATLARIRDGHATRLGGPFPTEVTPLAAEVNALLAHSETVVERARTHVGNLAHALKTPIAVLTNEAGTQRGRLADTVRQQTTLMQRQVDHSLARARTAATGSLLTARTDVGPVVAGLVRTVRRIYADRSLSIAEEVADGLVFRGEHEDLNEVVGNLLDNACKWARQEIRIGAAADEEQLAVWVEDDGPGLSAEDRERAVRRGARLDETAQGSGLGLAIVRDIADLYGGALRLDQSELGGLRTTIRLPAAR